MVQIAGKYKFVSQDKFEDYLKAAGVGLAMRKVIASTSPEIVIEVTGSTYNIQTITSMKTVKVEFTLDQPYETDPGTGKVGKYVTSLEGDTLVTKNAETGNVAARRQFTDDSMVQTMYADAVTATRTFKRA